MTPAAAFLVPGYDPLTVVASVLIAVYASFVALDLAKRVRSADRSVARAWLLGGSLAMGTGIWAEHFIGMLAFRLPIPIGYDYLVTFASWAAAVAASGAALAIAGRRRLTAWRLVGGALVMGGGICAMHYLGMQAMAMEPGIVWSPWLVAASAGIAVGASAVALSIFFWLRTRSEHESLAWQACAALVMGGAISGMHYTGMAAAHFAAGSVCRSAGDLAGGALGVLVALAATALLTIALIASVFDARMQSSHSRMAASLRRANEELQRIAFKDPLTGLPNRLVFEDRLRNAVARCEREQTRVAVLFVDLDGFKPINDSFGHGSGDEVLREVGRRLGLLARQADTVARVGGDEFLLLLEGGQLDEAAAALVAKRTLQALNQPYVLSDREVHLSCSIGIVFHPDHGSHHKLIAHADAAMYAAKRAGGSTYCFFEARMDAGSRDQVELQRDLRRALDHGELELYYQPKIHGVSGQVTGAEALMRWHHPTRGMVPPGVFIPIAERFGLIGVLGNWVIDESARQMRLWLDGGLRMRVSINLSVHQLRQEELSGRLRQALDRHRVDAALLTCEITESVAMDDAQPTLRALERLAATGVQLSIDDFGTGYSSLSYLRRMPAGQLKIDRSFVSDLEHSSDARAIVDAVVRLAHALGLKVVAEGVETTAQQELLLELGCDELQGYLYARPMPAKALTLWAMDDAPQAPGSMAFRPSLFGGVGTTSDA
ncbi:putative bifunctional diguanylate cyclase/phosphodiesterase [Methylibium rhizosphaerae]|uniref:putative bifunctional diguanylate cyclase/phosphodiesterase n=1 Tax=Methylibium rhizosphaerae TaxID=2570323 RepID=UPI00112C5E1F|nr:EAL domain-containing protein [Methylibium rhizosphaerae]